MWIPNCACTLWARGCTLSTPFAEITTVVSEFSGPGFKPNFPEKETIAYFVARFSLISQRKVKSQGDLWRIKCVFRIKGNNHIVYPSLQVEEKVFQFIDQKQEYQVSGALGLNWVKLFCYLSVENPCSAKLPFDLKFVELRNKCLKFNDRTVTFVYRFSWTRRTLTSFWHS